MHYELQLAEDDADLYMYRGHELRQGRDGWVVRNAPLGSPCLCRSAPRLSDALAMIDTCIRESIACEDHSMLYDLQVDDNDHDAYAYRGHELRQGAGGGWVVCGAPGSKECPCRQATRLRDALTMVDQCVRQAMHPSGLNQAAGEVAFPA